MLKELERPEVQKIYTTQEIADYLETSASIIRNIAHYYNIEKKVCPTKNSRAAYYTYDSVRLIKEHYEAKRNKERQDAISRMKVVKPELTLDEMKKLHPLVTEERFLNLNYWPDITPKCFVDLDV